MRPDRTFRSRIDAWLVVLMAGAAAAPLLAAGWLLLHGEWRGVVVLTLWGLVTTLLLGALTQPLRYMFWTDRLHIQSGWLAWDLPYPALRRAAPSRNPLSAPAWSLRRIKITSVDGSSILVSPDDEKSFMDELAARCPQLTPTPRGLEASHPPP
jgi:hypothetical protein